MLQTETFPCPLCYPLPPPPLFSHHPLIDDAVAAHDAQATAIKQRPKLRTSAPMELQSVSSHAAAASAKSHDSAGHQQQSAADIAAAAGIVAAAAALQVIQSATEEVQAELQVFPSINSCLLALQYCQAALHHFYCLLPCMACCGWWWGQACYKACSFCCCCCCCCCTQFLDECSH